MLELYCSALIIEALHARRSFSYLLIQPLQKQCKLAQPSRIPLEVIDCAIMHFHHDIAPSQKTLRHMHPTVQPVLARIIILARQCSAAMLGTLQSQCRLHHSCKTLRDRVVITGIIQQKPPITKNLPTPLQIIKRIFITSPSADHLIFAAILALQITRHLWYHHRITRRQEKRLRIIHRVMLNQPRHTNSHSANPKPRKTPISIFTIINCCDKI